MDQPDALTETLAGALFLAYQGPEMLLHRHILQMAAAVLETLAAPDHREALVAWLTENGISA